MPRKTYAEKIKDAEVMSAGLLNNAEKAGKRGLGADFTDKLRNNLQKVITLNNEQERLKSTLKQKTAELDATMTELDVQMSEARKLVKIEFPQPQWKEFGIDAKR
jgi:molybdenum-dependent DNA-binding transcriptional regulator ModE